MAIEMSLRASIGNFTIGTTGVDLVVDCRSISFPRMMF